MTEVLIIDGNTVRSLLTMPVCIDAMKTAAIAVSEKSITAPLRSSMQTRSDSKDNSANTLLLMPGSSVEPPVYGTKTISLHPDNPKNGLPAIQGFVSLFDHHTGTPLAIIEGASLTAIRTAAASGMATRLLARDNAVTHGVFGSGVQARTHVQAIIAARPFIKETLIWARDYEKAQRLANALEAEFGVHVRACKDAERVAASDIVTTVTAAEEPLMNDEWLAHGAHLNIVGAHTPNTREADTKTILSSRVFVETLENAFKEAGELVIPEKEGVYSRADVAGEIGDVASGKCVGRENSEQITLYKSLGNIAQDLHAAWAVYAQAKETGAGIRITL